MRDIAPGIRRYRVAILLSLLGLLLMACSDNGDLEKHLDKGHTYFAEGHYEDAQLEGLYVLMREQENAEAQHLIARSLLMQNKDSEAESYFRELAKFSSAYAREAAMLYNELAQEDYRANQKSRATRRWRIALNLFPHLDLGPYSFFMASKCYDDREWQQAADLYGRALAAYPDTSAVRNVRFPYGVSLYRLERWDQSLVELEKFLAAYHRHRQRFEAILIYQEILIKQAEYSNARMDYENAVRLLRKSLRYKENPPKTSEALLVLGDCYERMQDYNAAADCYRKIINANVGGVGRYYDTAIEKLGRLDKAKLR
ncbi:MAG: tetratricopeptide repeat protein [bacterium]|nr:tetratricopeptide repeat protein [bacterium]